VVNSRISRAEVFDHGGGRERGRGGCLGATAAQALLGKDFRVSQRRGEFVESPIAEHVVATVHPSSILRAPDDETRHAEMARFTEELKRIAKVIHGLG
jgi:uracil-DNA glycosylase